MIGIAAAGGARFSAASRCSGRRDERPQVLVTEGKRADEITPRFLQSARRLRSGLRSSRAGDDDRAHAFLQRGVRAVQRLFRPTCPRPLERGSFNFRAASEA